MAYNCTIGGESMFFFSLKLDIVSGVLLVLKISENLLESNPFNYIYMHPKMASRPFNVV